MRTTILAAAILGLAIASCGESDEGHPSESCGSGTAWSAELGLCVPVGSSSTDSGSDVGDDAGDTGTGGDTDDTGTDAATDSDCVPDCIGWCGGDDGCGGVCPDECELTGQTCDRETDLCVGDCLPLSCDDLGAECGDEQDGCGSAIVCGACGEGEFCDDGLCEEGTCPPDCDGTSWGGDDGCGGECACGVGFDPMPDGTCVERDVDCIRVDRGAAQIFIPSGVRTTFRVTDCDGLPIRALDEERDVIRVINDETGGDFNDSAEGGSRSGVANPSKFGLYAVLALDMSDSIVLDGDGVAAEVLDAAEAFVRAAVELQPPGRRHWVEIRVFGAPSDGYMIQDFTQDPSALYGAIDTLRERFAGPDATGLGTTDLFGAYLLAVGDLPGVAAEEALTEQSVVVVTDGLHEAGDTDARRAAAQAARDVAVTDYSLNAFAIYVSPDGCDALPDAVGTQLRTLTTNDTFLTCADGGAGVGATFADLARTLEAIAESNYAVGVCTPVALGSPTMTIRVEYDGVDGAPAAVGELAVPYPTESLNGVLEGCEPAYILDPCLDRECGPPHIGSEYCGDCGGTATCDAGTCFDPCAGGLCGRVEYELSDGSTSSRECGGCERGSACCDGRGAGEYPEACPDGANNVCEEVCDLVDCYFDEYSFEGATGFDLIVKNNCQDDGGVCACDGMSCGDFCVDTVRTRDTFCGGCDIECGDDQVCSEGACVCPFGEIECDGSCQPSTAASCGCSATACDDLEACFDGECTPPRWTVPIPVGAGSCTPVASNDDWVVMLDRATDGPAGLLHFYRLDPDGPVALDPITPVTNDGSTIGTATEIRISGDELAVSGRSRVNSLAMYDLSGDTPVHTGTYSTDEPVTSFSPDAVGSVPLPGSETTGFVRYPRVSATELGEPATWGGLEIRYPGVIAGDGVILGIGTGAEYWQQDAADEPDVTAVAGPGWTLTVPFQRLSGPRHVLLFELAGRLVEASWAVWDGDAWTDWRVTSDIDSMDARSLQTRAGVYNVEAGDYRIQDAVFDLTARPPRWVGVLSADNRGDHPETVDEQGRIAVCESRGGFEHDPHVVHIYDPFAPGD